MTLTEFNKLEVKDGKVIIKCEGCGEWRKVQAGNIRNKLAWGSRPIVCKNCIFKRGAMNKGGFV